MVHSRHASPGRDGERRLAARPARDGQIAAGRRRRDELRLDEATYASAVSVLEAELAEGPKTRAEIGDALVRHGVRLKPKTQAAIHLIQRAALEGRVCYGADRGRQKELVLLRDWVDVGPALDPDVALVALARRYIASDPCADGIDVVYISYTHRRRPVKVKLRKVGNSYTVTVPKEIVDSLSLEEGGELEIDLIAREDRVVLKPARSRLDRVMARMRAKARARGVTEAAADAAVREIRGRR